MHITLSQEKIIIIKNIYIYIKPLCFALYTRLQLITRRDRCWVALRLSLPPQWVCALVNKQVVSELKCYLTRQQIPSPRVRTQTSNSVLKSKEREISSRLFLTEIISQPHSLTKSLPMKLYTFWFPSSPLRNSQHFKGTLEVTAQCLASASMLVCFLEVLGNLHLWGGRRVPHFSLPHLSLPGSLFLQLAHRCQMSFSQQKILACKNFTCPPGSFSQHAAPWKGKLAKG